MPEWAATIVALVVVSSGGYLVRTLVKISNTLGNIDAKLGSHNDRLVNLERLMYARRNRASTQRD